VPTLVSDAAAAPLPEPAETATRSPEPAEAGAQP
jgi:hypothetical protein